MGNSDFADAKLTIEEYLKNMNMKEVDFFMGKVPSCVQYDA